jgi:hypothetical protein
VGEDNSAGKTDSMDKDLVHHKLFKHFLKCKVSKSSCVNLISAAESKGNEEDLKWDFGAFESQIATLHISPLCADG